MILRFSGRKLLQFDSFDFEFSEGLNVITGETGAGKSILLKGLQALLGKKVELFGDEETWLEAIVRIDHIDEEIEELGIEEGEHIVSLSAGKRWVYRLDGRMYPQSVVERLFEDRVHFHQQNSHVNLLKKRYQLSLLDKFCGNEQMLAEYFGLYRKMIQLEKIVRELSAENYDEKIEELNAELSFFERHKPSEEEERSLKERFEKIHRSKQLASLAGDILYTLDEDLSTQLWKLVRAAERTSSLLPRQLLELLRDVASGVDEIRLLVKKFMEELELEDSHELEARLSVYNELRRRFGPNWQDIKENWARLEKQRDELIAKKLQLQDAQRKLRSVEEHCWRLAKQLHENRRKAATELENLIKQNLEELSMTLQFTVKVEELDRLTATGVSDVEFVVEVNGETKPLREVLSGGELSRTVLAAHLSVVNQFGNVFVFDEIDSGVGGMTGNVLGEKLKLLAKNSQVIVVTHLPQIARHADAHFVVMKQNDSMHVKQLAMEERKAELLRMIGGKDVWRDVV